MQGVAISKIPGALVKEIAVPDSEPLNSNIRGYNQCRSEMSQVKIGLKREKIIIIIKDEFCKPAYQHNEPWIERTADAILQALPDLLTVVKEGM